MKAVNRFECRLKLHKYTARALKLLSTILIVCIVGLVTFSILNLRPIRYYYYGSWRVLDCLVKIFAATLPLFLVTLLAHRLNGRTVVTVLEKW